MLEAISGASLRRLFDLIYCIYQGSAIHELNYIQTLVWDDAWPAQDGDGVCRRQGQGTRQAARRGATGND